MSETRQPARVLVGHCPECQRVVLVENNRETWPLVECKCGWRGGTSAVARGVRVEEGQWGGQGSVEVRVTDSTGRIPFMDDASLRVAVTDTISLLLAES